MSHQQNRKRNRRRRRGSQSARQSPPAGRVRTRETFKSLVRGAGTGISHPEGDWPLLLLLEREGQVSTLLLREELHSTVEKNQLANVLLPSIVREHEPRTAGFAMHCWTVSEVDDPQLEDYVANGGLLAKHPARKECVNLLIVDDEANAECWLAPVVRHQDKPPELGQWSRGEATGGGFVAPLQRAVAGTRAEPHEELVGARPETVAFYQALIEMTLPSIGDEPIEDALLLNRMDGVIGLDFKALVAAFKEQQTAVAEMVYDDVRGLRNLALLLGQPPSTWRNARLGQLLGDDEGIVVAIADDAGISFYAASISRDAGVPQVRDWVISLSPPKDELSPLVSFLNHLRSCIV